MGELTIRPPDPACQRVASAGIEREKIPVAVPGKRLTRICGQHSRAGLWPKFVTPTDFPCLIIDRPRLRVLLARYLTAPIVRLRAASRAALKRGPYPSHNRATVPWHLRSVGTRVASPA